MTDKDIDYKCKACGCLFWTAEKDPQQCLNATELNECDAVGQIVEITDIHAEKGEFIERLKS